MRRLSNPPLLPPPPLPKSVPPPLRKVPQVSSSIRPDNSVHKPEKERRSDSREKWRFSIENIHHKSIRSTGELCVGFLAPNIKNGQISTVENLLNLTLLDVSNHLNVVCQSAIPKSNVSYFEKSRNHSVEFSRVHVFPENCRYEIRTVNRDSDESLKNVVDVRVHSFLMRSTDASLTTTYCTCIKWKRRCENPFLTKLMTSKSPKLNFESVLYEPVAVVVFATKPRYRSFQALLSRLPLSVMFGKGRTNYACTTESLNLVYSALQGCDSLAHAITTYYRFQRTFPEIETYSYTKLFEPLMWYLERMAVRVATGGHVWTEQCTESKLRHHHFFVDDVNSRIHCRLCKIERFKGYLQNAFKRFASKDFFVGEFSGNNSSSLPLTPTSAQSSYDLCSSPKFSDSTFDGGIGNGVTRGSFFSKMDAHRRLSSKQHRLSRRMRSSGT